MTNAAKKHHYVPQAAILKHFSDDEGKLYYHVRGQELVFRKPIKEIFFQKHLYSLEDKCGNKNAIVETEYLSKLDEEAALITSRIVQACRIGKLPNLDVGDRLIFDEFLAVQWVRVPDRFREDDVFSFREFNKILDLIKEDYQSKNGFLSTKEWGRFSDSEFRKRLYQELLPRGVIQSQSIITNFLRNIGLAFFFIDNDQERFIVGSMPIVSFDDKSLLIEGVSISSLFVISEKVAVAPLVFLEEGGEALFKIKETEIIYQINKKIALDCPIIASSSEVLLENLLRFR